MASEHGRPVRTVARPRAAGGRAAPAVSARGAAVPEPLRSTGGRRGRLVTGTGGAIARSAQRVTNAGAASWSLARRAAATVRPLGWFVIGLALASWIVSVLLGWAEAAAIAATAGLLAIGCTVFLFGPRVFTVDVELPRKRVEVGERAYGSIVLRTRAGRRLLPLRVELTVGGGVAGFDFSPLAPGEEEEESFQIPTARRGVIPVGPARAVRADPVGCFARVVSQSGVQLFYVHPRIVRVPSVGAGFVRDLEGRESQDRSQSDIAFHSLREYRAGDDRRYVHWRTSARTGVLMVQEFLDTRRAHVLVALDDEAAHYATPEDFETAVSAAGSIAVQAILDGQERTVVVGGRTLPTATRGALLDALAGVEPTATPAGALRASAAGSVVAPDASLVVLVTGAEADPADLRRAARRFRAGVRVAVVRVGRQRDGFQLVDNLLMVDMAELAELPAVTRVVVSA